MKNTKEETRAINRLKEKLEEKFYIVDILHEDLEILLNLIERYKRIAEMNLKDSEEFKNEICEHRCILGTELKELEEQLEQALKDKCKIADERNQLLVKKRKLMSEYHKRVQEKCDLERELEDVKEECHEQYISNEHKKENWIHKNILNSYIPKEAIRELIKDIEENGYFEFCEQRDADLAIEKIKELLGE